MEETAEFAAEERGQRVVLYQSKGKAATDQILIGEYTSFYWTSLGKAILANLPKQRFDEIVAEHGLPTQTYPH